MRLKGSLKFIGIGTILLLAIIGLSGCNAATGPQFQTFKKSKNNKGMLYVYRVASPNGAFAQYNIKVDNRSIGTLVSGGYISKELSPGKKTVYVLLGKSIFGELTRTMAVSIQKNKITCVKFDNNAVAFIGVNNKQCLEEIKKTKQSFYSEDLASQSQMFSATAGMASAGLIMSAAPTAPNMTLPNTSSFMKK